MSFLNDLHKFCKEHLNEQTLPPAPYPVPEVEPVQQQPTQQQSTVPGAPEAPVIPDVQPEPEVERLSPESEVLLVRLIKKALVTEIDPNDVDTISDLGDINEKNAKSSLKMLINIMKKYSSDIDVE